MNELLKNGWCDFLNGQHHFHTYEFNFMKMIGNLIEHANMLKNHCGYSTLRVITPECVPSGKSIANKNEDEINRDDYWKIRRRNRKKKQRHNYNSDEVANYKNMHKVMESDSDDYEEEEKKVLEEEFF